VQSLKWLQVKPYGTQLSFCLFDVARVTENKKLNKNLHNWKYAEYTRLNAYKIYVKCLLSLIIQQVHENDSCTQRCFFFLQVRCTNVLTRNVARNTDKRGSTLYSTFKIWHVSHPKEGISPSARRTYSVNCMKRKLVRGQIGQWMVNTFTSKQERYIN
jgi:hypothetical protein